MAVQTGEVGTKELADLIQRNCSMKKSDVAGLRVKFLAEGKKTQDTGKVTRTFLNGCTLQKWEDPNAKKKP